MALVDEIKAQENTGGQNATLQRPSLLVQHISQNGAEGLNQGYVNYALANGGGFGATAAGVVKDTEGNLHPIYNFNRSKEEIAYAKALKRGENLDTWYAKAKDESDAAAENYKALSDKLASLNAASDRALTASPFAVAAYQNAPSKEEISHLEEAIKQAEKDQQRKSDDFAAAKAYKDYRDTTRPVDEAAERGVIYKDQYDAYSQSLDRLNAEKQKLLNDHAFSKIGGQLNENGEVERAPAGKADEDNDRLEKLTREIERLEGQRAYAENFLTKDAGAKQIIAQGEELARIAHANKQQNEINALEENDSDAGFRAAVAFRQAERSGLSPDDRWTQEQKDLYHYYWGAYGQDAAEGFAERVNRYLNSEEAAAGNGVLPGTEIVQQWAERGGKWATAAKALVALAGKLGVNNLVYNAASYIDRMLNVAATGRDAGRSFALPNEIVDAAHSTVANKLNETQIVGGKGLGDLYQLGTSMAQSLVYGNGLGKIGTLGAFFFQAANSSYDEAMQRGASAQYAAAYSTLCGISEGAWETFSFDKLIKGDWTNHFFRTLVSQGFIEGSEEVNTSLFNKYAETLAARLTNEQSMVEREISSLVASGMSRKDAEHQIWTQFAKDVAWDFAGGYISGFGSSAIQSGVNATQNKLWEMRKDSVLGKENADGQREGGKKNASNDDLSKMFDRALKRGDIRGAEQILQVIEQRGATAEEQEYGPVDPTANERMRRKLERQLNGERVNPQTENAEIVTESATNRQLAEEARVQAEFPTVSPITMELVRRLDGKDFVTMAKSMTTQELAEVARYARSIGEEAKADLLERIRLDPTYQYEEQPPAHTDEEAPPLNTSQNAVGAQEAPAGQITKPSQQNAAQTVKPGVSEASSATPEYATAEPLTSSTESGTVRTPNLLENIPYKGDVSNLTREERAANLAYIIRQQDFLDEAGKNGSYSQEEMNKAFRQLNEEIVRILGRDLNKFQIDSLWEEAERINNGGKTNAGEQAVQQPEAAEAADFGVGRRPAGAGAATGQLGASENIAEGEQRAQERTGRALPRFAQEDVNELSDVEESAPITQEQKNEYSSLAPLTNDGIQVVSKPQIGSRLHLAWSLAKKLGQKVLFARNYNGSVFKDGSTAYQAKGNVIVDADNTQMELATAVAHEAGHDKYFKKFGGYADIVNGAYTKRLNFFTSVFNDALGMMKGLQTMRTAEKYIRDDRGYGKRYNRSRARYTREVSTKITNPLAQNATNLVAEMEKARSVEEFMNQLLAYDVDFLDAMSDETGIPIEDIYKLRESLLSGLQEQGIFTAEEIAAINDAARALEEGNFTDDLSDEEEAAGFEDVDTDAEAASFENGRWYQRQEVGLNKTLNTLISGNTEAIQRLSEEDLLKAMKYIMDKGLPKGQSRRVSTGQAFSNLFLGVDSRKANNATAWTYERGYQGGTFYGMNQQQKDNMLTAAEAILTELTDRGYPITSLSDFTKYANDFGILTDRNGNELDLSTQPKSEENTDKNAGVISMQEEDAREAAYDRRNKGRDLDALEKAAAIQRSGMSWREAPSSMKRGANFVKEAVPTKPEDHGWIKPVEVSEKEVRRAREAVEAKGKEAELKDRIKTLEAQKGYLTAVANAMREARSGLYANEDVEQRKADLGYLADNIKEQMDQLDADMGYMTDELDDVLAEDPSSPRAVTLLNALDNAQNAANALNVQLEALRDEYKHLGEDSASLRNVRTQIDSVVSEIAALSRQLDGVSKRAERADWGANKRTLFQAEMADNPNGIHGRTTGQRGEYFMSQQEPTQVVHEFGSEDPTVHMSTKELDDYLKQMRSSEAPDVDAEAADFGEPTRGMGTGYAGMQRSRSKDGTLEFRTMYDDALPTRPATDKSRKPLAVPSTAYSSVSQAARSILNSKNSFLDFSKDRPKDISSKVTNTMGQLREHVREMMEGDHPVNALMQLSNMVHEFENDDDLRVFSSDSIKKAVDELNDIYYNQDITNEEKARRMVENATKTLTLISKRVQLVDRGYNMLKTFTGPRKKRDGTTYWSKYKAMQLNPSTLFKAMDGFARDKNGSGYQIAKMIENGTALYTITQTNALKRLSDISSLEGFKEFSEGNATPFDIDGVKITEQQAVEFIMQVRNLRNTNVTGKNGPTNRLNTIDGFSIMDKNGKSTFIERSEDADGTNTEWFLNLAEAMENSLSPAAKKYLETATDILDDLGRQTSDMRTNLIGTGFEGSINGTYYPITYGSKNGKSNSQQSNPAGLFSGPSYQSRTRNVGGYVNIKNVSDTMDRYIHWASNTIGYGEVAELLQVMNSTGGRMQNLSTLANEMLGQGYSEYISKFVDDVNEVPDGQKNNNSALAVLRRNMASGALLGNLGVAAKQAASLWSGVGVLSPQALLSAETYFGGHTGAGNVLLQSRSTGTSLDPTISEILHNDSFMGKLMKRSGVTEFMGKATALVDYQTVKRLFAATVVDTKLSFPGMDQNSELFAKTVEAKFQDVVIQTQPIFVKNARSGYLRSNDELMKAFAMFRTQPAQNLNAIVTAVGEYNAMKGTEFGKAAGKKLRNTIIGQTASAITFATLSAIVGFARHGLKKYRDDDDEISWAEVAKRIGLDSINSLANITVVGGDIAKAIIDIATGGETREFNDVNAGIITMLFDTLSSVTTFGTNVVKALKDGQPLAVFNAGRQATDNLLQLKGIPANTIYRLLNTVTMYSADALRALSGGKLGNRAMYDDALKMLDSYIRGDLTEEGAKTQAARAFRKDQPENLLYNLGILSSLTNEGSADKGASWLNTRIQGKTEAEREAYKEDELARLGRNLNAGERIANYLADSALSTAQKDEAISKFATTSGYNVLYESLRAAGMTPKAAVEELGKTDNKTGLSTDIRSDDSLADLYAGKDSPGETNDVPALDKKNTDEYVNFVSAMKVFRDTGNYSQLDKLVDQYSKLDDNTRAVIEAKDNTIGKYREYRSMGFSTKDYYNVKDAIKQAQADLDLAANTGTAVKLVGLSKTNLSKAQIQKLVNSDALGISKTGKSLISVLGKYGYTVGDIGMFMYNTDWTNDDANGTLSQQEVVLALAKEKRLTEAQRSAIYEELKPLLRNEYKISHWYDKSYEDELNYLLQNGKTSGRAS